MDNHSQPDTLADVKVPTYGTTLSQCPSSEKANVYLVNTEKVKPGLASVVKILEKIQLELAECLEELGDAEFEDDNVWESREELRSAGRHLLFTEENMMNRLADATSTLPWCVVDEPGTSLLVYKTKELR